MLKKWFDITLAEYHAIEEVEVEEIRQADLVTVRGFVEGGIYHTPNMIWRGNIANINEPLDFVRSSSDRKLMRKNRRWFDEMDYQFQTVPLTEEIFETFQQLYQDTTLQRERAFHFNLRGMTLEKLNRNIPVYIAGMFKDSQLESGVIFSLEENMAKVSTAAKKRFQKVSGGVGGLLELELIDFCLQNHIKEISHGKGVNPVGITAKAGLFEFKTRYGFSAFPADYWQTTFILNPNVMLSDLVFVTSMENRIGYLVVSQHPETVQVKKYITREVEVVRVVSFEEVVAAAKHRLTL